MTEENKNQTQSGQSNQPDGKDLTEKGDIPIVGGGNSQVVIKGGSLRLRTVRAEMEDEDDTSTTKHRAKKLKLIAPMGRITKVTIEDPDNPDPARRDYEIEISAQSQGSVRIEIDYVHAS